MASFADVGGKGEVVQPGGSYDFRHEIDTRGSGDGLKAKVVDGRVCSVRRGSNGGAS